jgi:hypothetical protein
MENQEEVLGAVKVPRVLPPAGLHRAHCFGVVVLGTIDDSYMGKPKRSKKVRLYFELAEEKYTWNPEKGPECFTVEQDFTLSMASKANLRILIGGCYGAALTDEQASKFNIVNLIGCEMTLNLIKKTSSNGNDRMEIMSMTMLKDSEEIPPCTKEPLLFTFAPPFKQAAFDRLPQFLQEKIKSSDEYRENYGDLAKAEVASPVSAAPFTTQTAEAPKKKMPF